jgi:2-dehydropantoate 2-reductase
MLTKQQMNSPRILVFGAGSIRGYFGGRLAETDVDVTFLVREAWQKKLERDGLRIESPYGNTQLRVKTALARDVGGKVSAMNGAEHR